jgi:hypothetical protein
VSEKQNLIELETNKKSSAATGERPGDDSTVRLICNNEKDTFA